MSTLSKDTFSELQIDHLAQNGWLIMDQLFSPTELDQIFQNAQALWNTNKFHVAKIGRSEQQQRLESVRSDTICWLERQDPLWLSTFAKLDLIKKALNQNLYLGLENFEGHLARYDSGQKYDPHIDQSPLKSPLHGERIITLVLYLNPNWLPEDAGQLCLFLNNEKKLIEPLWGRAVFFKSDTITHSVLESKNTRWSLTGWFRRH